MKKVFYILLIIAMVSCNNNNRPDEADIQIQKYKAEMQKMKDDLQRIKDSLDRAGEREKMLHDLKKDK